MKKLAYLLAIIVCTLTASCSSDAPLREYSGIHNEIYHYEIEDTILSADSHEFTISMTGDVIPEDWGIIRISKLEGINIPDTIDYDHLNDWEKVETIECSIDGNITEDTYLLEGNKFSLDWISFQKQPTKTSPNLKISMGKNDTNKVRGVLLIFGEINPPGFDCGYLFIVQEPMPDMEH